MRKRWPLALVALLAASAVLAFSCQGPPGPVGAGSPGPTGPQGVQGSIGGLPPSSLFRHVVVSCTGNQVSLSADMLQVGNDFYGNVAASSLAYLSPPSSDSWIRVLALSSNGTHFSAGLSNSIPPLGNGISAVRQVGWVRLKGSTQLLPARQVDRRVTYLPGGRSHLLLGAPSGGGYTAVSGTGGTQPAAPSAAVPPGVRQVFVLANLEVASGSAATEADLFWSLDGSTGELIGRCTTGSNFAGALGTPNTVVVSDCASEQMISLDGAQQFFYRLTAGSVNLDVTGYLDETL